MKHKAPFKKQSQQSDLFWVEGKHACLEQLRQNPEQIRRLVFRDAKTQNSFLSEASNLGLLRDSLQSEIDSEARESIQVQVFLKAVPFEEFQKRLQNEALSLIVALDHISDPRNLGAIVRTAAFFGITTVLVPADRQVMLTQAAVSTAQGGFAVTQLVVCTNLARTLTELKENHSFWVVALDGGGQQLNEKTFSFEKTVIVFGAEGAGLSQNVRKKSDLIVSIPGAGQGFDSLNVSVAAGIAIHAAHKNNSNPVG